MDWNAAMVGGLFGLVFGGMGGAELMRRNSPDAVKARLLKTAVKAIKGINAIAPDRVAAARDAAALAEQIKALKDEASQVS